MSEKIKIYAIKKPDGTFWSTPKGKSSWYGIGHAKNSWNCHNYCQTWKEKAEPIGWSIVKLKEFRLVEEDQDE